MFLLAGFLSMADTTASETEFTDEELRAALKRVGDEARRAAFAAGRPVMIAKKGRLVLLYADGSEQFVGPATADQGHEVSGP